MVWHTPRAPLAEAIAGIVGKVPPFHLDGIWQSKDIPDPIAAQLQDWCCNEVDKTRHLHWATGGSVIEAAELLLDRAIENANLKPPE